jgi:hypothetical protein
MKTQFSLALIILFGLNCFGQEQLPSALQAKAAKKALAEAKMYHSKGFAAFKTNLSLNDLLKDYYEQSYREIAPGERVFINTQGLARASSVSAAFQNAKEQAIRRIPALLQLYFNSWISVDKRSSDKEKAKLIDAVNASGKALEKMVSEQNPDKIYRLLKEKSGKYQAVIRLLYKQEKLRNLAREKIVKIAGESSAMSEDSIRAYLQF